MNRRAASQHRGRLGVVGAVLVALTFGGVLAVLTPSVAHAQSSIELAARVHFEEGNRALAQATALRGQRRAEALQRALSAYTRCLAVTRTRNVLFNTALTLEMLERLEEAFDLWQEYLSMSDLSDAERSEGETRQNALRPNVALIEVQTLAGSQVWIGRRDLPPSGRGHFLRAWAPGEHRVFVELAGYRNIEDVVTLRRGATLAFAPTQEANAVQVALRGPTDATFRIDGVAVPAGTVQGVPAGEHRVELCIGERVVRAETVMVPNTESFDLDWSHSSTTEVHVRPRPGASIDALSVEADGARVPNFHAFALQPGDRRLRFSAEAAAATELRLELGAAPVTLEVDVSREGRADVQWFRGISTVGFGLALVVATTFSVLSTLAFNAFNQSPSGLGANEVDTYNLVADVAWGGVALLGVGSLVAWLLDGRSEAQLRARIVDAASVEGQP